MLDSTSIPTVLISASSSKTTFSSTEVQSLCGQSSICTIGPSVVFQMNDSINVAALVIQGSLQWTDVTATRDYHLCAGYIFVSANGSFNLHVSEHNAYIYLKVNRKCFPFVPLFVLIIHACMLFRITGCKKTQHYLVVESWEVTTE